MATMDSVKSEELPAALSGLTLKFNPLEDSSEISRLLTLIDSVFAVFLIESQDNIMNIESRANSNQTIMFYSHPYEQFCKENWSFLSKFLRQSKMDKGLDFLLENFGFSQDDKIHTKISQGHFKYVGVRAEKESLKFKIQYTLDTDKYGTTLESFLKAKKSKN